MLILRLGRRDRERPGAHPDGRDDVLVRAGLETPLLFARGLKNAYPDLDVTIREADVAPLQVQGPKSKPLMVKLLGEGILTSSTTSGATPRSPASRSS